MDIKRDKEDSLLRELEINFHIVKKHVLAAVFIAILLSCSFHKLEYQLLAMKGMAASLQLFFFFMIFIHFVLFL